MEEAKKTQKNVNMTMILQRTGYFLFSLGASFLLCYLFAKVVMIGCDESILMFNYRIMLTQYGVPLEASYGGLGKHHILPFLMSIVIPRFGTTLAGIKAYLVISYSFCLLPCFYLVRNTKKTYIEQVLSGILLTLLLLPNASTNPYHMYSTAVVLWIFLLVKQLKEKDSMPLTGLCILALGFFAWYRAKDLLIIVMALLLPAFICGLRALLKKEERRKYIIPVIAGLLVIYGLLKVLEHKGFYLINPNVYGGSGYTAWAGLGSLFSVGIPMFMDLVDHLMAIPVGQNVISLESIRTVLKYFWLILFLIFFVKKTWKYVRKPEEMSFIDSFLVVSSWCILVVCMSNKVLQDAYVKYGYTSALNRYFAPLWFFVPIIFIRSMQDILSVFLTKWERRGRLLNQCIIAAALGALIVSAIPGYPKSHRNAAYNVWEDMGSYLEDHGYKEGVVYEDVHVVDVDLWTDYAVHTGNVGESLGGVADITLEEAYHNLNFAGVRTVEKEKYEQLEETHYVDSVELKDYQGELQGKLYFYDHDVRFKNMLVDTSRFEDDSFTCRIPLGTTVLEVKGENLPEDVLEITSNRMDLLSVQTEVKEDALQYTLVAKDTCEVSIFAENGESVEIKTVYAAVLLEEDEKELAAGKKEAYTMSLNKGTYIVTVCGQNIMNLAASAVAGGTVEVMNQGTERARFYVIVPEDYTEVSFVLENTGEDSIIMSHCSYELTKDVREAVMEERETMPYVQTYY